MEGVIGGVFGGVSILLLALIAFLASIGTYVEFTRASGSPLCRPGSKMDCLRVYSIPHAWILGFHLSQIAPVYYTIILVLAILAVIPGFTPALKLLSFLAWEGAILAPYMIYLMARYAGAYCIYCLTMHFSTIVIAVLTYNVVLKSLTS